MRNSLRELCPETTGTKSDRITYRLRGSWALRDLALADGSKAFAAPSGTCAFNEDAVSSSSSWSDRRLVGASSETLRRPKKACEREAGRIDRGNALARYLEGSLAAILGGEGIGVIVDISNAQ